MKINNVVIAGGGVLGSQIAFQTAYSGFNVTIWLRSEKSVERAKEKIKNVKQEYINAIELMDSKEGKTPGNWSKGISEFDNFKKDDCLKLVTQAFNSIKYEIDLNEALKDCDLVIESMAENIDDKKDFYKKIAPLLEEKTIVVTNSSTIIPSKLAKYTKREDKFLSLHFANSIWKNNTAEVMCQRKTDMKNFDIVLEFARNIHMVALPLKKEKSGYLLNSMLIPLLFSSLDLFVNGISDPESIDKAWVLGTGAPKGPFQILDTIGLKTAYDIVLMYVKIPSFLAPYNFNGMEKLLKKYIDEGKLGKSTKEGFYKYK